MTTSLPIRETQIKIRMKYHYTPVRTAKIKKKVIPLNAGEDAEKLDYSSVKWQSHTGK